MWGRCVAMAIWATRVVAVIGMHGANPPPHAAKCLLSKLQRRVWGGRADDASAPIPRCATRALHRCLLRGARSRAGRPPSSADRATVLHTLPGGFHRICHYGLLANGNRNASLASARALLGQAPEPPTVADDIDADCRAPIFVCWHCGAVLNIVQTFARSHTSRAPPPAAQPP